ncbi:uncharacterized protein LOC111714628 [Eurytemora carolleeae]|uniref:uncharacterized protein LOC111714628 n=1 Tax=Eurytemora carolleeae TaxID=1294199 RepID=UPI000C77CCC7|nr:uncharacterized protein LOC111714628 [Eurytemora carolleeae]|eukprot:XP_023345542.1 uncharacterized protein LOC111714628 [Eurytemora affinis]
MCFATDECRSKGGTSSGNCAAGFGVCCIFTISSCGSSSSNNITYITNPGFPSTYTTAGTCTYTINKCQNDICQLRLDFVTLVQGVSTNPQGCCGSSCTTVSDSLTVRGETGVNPPLICGTNTGEHMYIETGNLGTDSVSLALFVSGTSSNQWNIRVSQIPCTATYRAPNHCVKYFTGTTGTVTSYGFAGSTLLGSQNYKSCIRQETGYCSIVWDQTTLNSPADAFDLTNAPAAGTAENRIGSCINSYVQIPSGILGPATGNPIQEFCGENLGVQASTDPSTITSSTLPFDLATFTTASAMQDFAGGVSNGYSLSYRQQPC